MIYLVISRSISSLRDGSVQIPLVFGVITFLVFPNTGDISMESSRCWKAIWHVSRACTFAPSSHSFSVHRPEVRVDSGEIQSRRIAAGIIDPSRPGTTRRTKKTANAGEKAAREACTSFLSLLFSILFHPFNTLRYASSHFILPPSSSSFPLFLSFLYLFLAGISQPLFIHSVIRYFVLAVQPSKIFRVSYNPARAQQQRCASDILILPNIHNVCFRGFFYPARILASGFLSFARGREGAEKKTAKGEEKILMLF